MKRFWALFFVLCFVVVSLGGCGRTTATASKPGYRSDIRVEASVDEDGRVTVVSLSHNETPGIGDFSVTVTIELINKKQSVAIDAVAGATVSSLATIAAAEEAISKLAVDIEKFLSPSLTETTEYLTLDYDVVVVGAGGAGLTAAITAAEKGAKVVVMEKLGIPGGSTARSDGRIMAAGTELQQKYREADNSGSFAGYLYDFADKSLGSFRQLELAEHSAANLRFLENIGITFADNVYAAFEGQSPKRVHLVSNGDDTGGCLMIQPLVDKALELGVAFLYNTRAFELVQSFDGTVRGVRGKSSFGHVLTLNADAVILASGGFDRSHALLSEHGLSSGLSVSGVGSTGDGVELARSAGADIFDAASLIATLEDLGTGLFDTTGLIVDASGNRLGNEAGDPFLLSSTLLSRGYTTAYLIVDAGAYNDAVRAGLDVGKVVVADTVEELSEKTGMPDLNFAVAQYNIKCANKSDPEYGKPSRYLGALADGPFCAVPLALKTYGTLGGVVTNSRCQVLDNTGNMITGLYAAGEVMNGAFFITGFPSFGASLAEVLETGILAGDNAAKHALGF
jgi:Succinate dehydrogenase/fumarate reductase, flavoprotein subunit